MITLIIDVEAQNDFYPGYPLVTRSVYYCCRMVSAQYNTEFTNSHYEEVKKVYSVFICINPPGYRKNTINRYSITEENLVGDIQAVSYTHLDVYKRQEPVEWLQN